MTKTVLLTAMTPFVFAAGIHLQEFSKGSTIALFTGLMNYKGNLKPDSFIFQHSNFTAMLLVRKPVNRRTEKQKHTTGQKNRDRIGILVHTKVHLGLVHFTQDFDNTGKKVFLKPLSTEEQGLSEYPTQEPYSLA